MTVTVERTQDLMDTYCDIMSSGDGDMTQFNEVKIWMQEENITLEERRALLAALTKPTHIRMLVVDEIIALMGVARANKFTLELEAELDPEGTELDLNNTIELVQQIDPQ